MLNFWKNRKIISAWFVSYMIILIFAVLANFMAYMSIESSIAKQNNYYLTELLNNRRNEIDSLRQMVGSVAMELSRNTTVIKAATSRDMGNAVYFNMLEVAKELGVYRSIEGEFKNIYIYFPNFDYCVGLYAGNEASTFFSVHLADYKTSYSEWLDQMRDNHPGEFVKFNTGDGSAPVSASYILSVYNKERFIPYASIVIDVELKKLLPPSAGDRYNESFAIADNENRIFLSEAYERADDMQRVINKYGLNSGITHCGSHYMIAAESENSDWKYLYLLDKSVFHQSISAARRRIILFNLVLVFAAVFLSLKMSRQNYMPLKKLLKIFGSTDSASMTELSEMEKKILDIIAENHNYSEITEKLQDNQIKSSFISKLLSEKHQTGNKEEILSYIGVSFPYEKFTVVLFYIEIKDDMFFDDKKEDPEEEYRLARLIITNIMGDLSGSGYVTEYCDIGGMLCMVVNSETGREESELAERIKELQKIVLENFNIYFMAGISNPADGIDDLSRCFDEAMSCVEQHFFNVCDVVKYSDLDYAPISDLYISKAMEELLVNSMKAGDYASCDRAIDGIFEHGIKSAGKSIQAVKHILYELTAIMIKTIMDISAFENKESAVSRLIGMIDKVGINEDINKLKDNIKSVIRDFCIQNIEEPMQKTAVLAERARQFIDENFTDCNLTVSLIAEKCGVSAAYLSANFKKKYDVGVLEYINLVRTEKAKEILAAENCTMDKVAEKVGYGNRRSFFRMFSQYVGISPSKYRTMVLAGELNCQTGK